MKHLSAKLPIFDNRISQQFTAKTSGMRHHSKIYPVVFQFKHSLHILCILHDEEKTNYNIEKIYSSSVRRPGQVEKRSQMNVLFVTVLLTAVKTLT